MAAPESPGAPAAPKPYCKLTPYYCDDPPEWFVDSLPIPPVLDNLLLPLPPAAARHVLSAICLPFYSEPGYSLARGLQGLALQRADLRRYHAIVHGLPPEQQPELHVFAVADGWRKPDGTPILSESMLAEIETIFGTTLDIPQLRRMLGDKLPGDDDADAELAGGGFETSTPEGVLVQFVLPGVGSSREVLHPVTLDCAWALDSVARREPEGGYARARIRDVLRRTIKRAQKQKPVPKPASPARSKQGSGTPMSPARSVAVVDTPTRVDAVPFTPPVSGAILASLPRGGMFDVPPRSSSAIGVSPRSGVVFDPPRVAVVDAPPVSGAILASLPRGGMFDVPPRSSSALDVSPRSGVVFDPPHVAVVDASPFSGAILASLPRGGMFDVPPRSISAVE